MDTYHVVLFLHFFAVAAGFGAAGVMILCLLQLRSAQTVAEAAPWGMVAGKTEKVFPFVILGLFGTGAYMTSDIWTWDTHWIEVSIVGLVLISLQGPLLAGRRAHLLKEALMQNGPGPLGADARRLSRDAILWTVTLTNPAMVFAIMWNMTEKPGVAGAVASIVVAYAVGAALALLAARPDPVEATAAAEPAA